jgi:hypothetical protein
VGAADDRRFSGVDAAVPRAHQSVRAICTRPRAPFIPGGCVTRSQTPPKQRAKKLVRLLRVERPDYQYLKKVFQRAPGRVLIRIEPTAAVLHSSRPTDRPPIRRSRWDRKKGLSASVSASDHHFSDPQRNHQPKTATAQRRGGEKSGDLSGFGSGRCFR